MSYKSLIRTSYIQPISAQRMNYSDFHKNRIRYNIITNNKYKSKKCIIWIPQFYY